MCTQAASGKRLTVFVGLGVNVSLQFCILLLLDDVNSVLKFSVHRFPVWVFLCILTSAVPCLAPVSALSRAC